MQDAVIVWAAVDEPVTLPARAANEHNGQRKLCNALIYLMISHPFSLSSCRFLLNPGNLTRRSIIGALGVLECASVEVLRRGSRARGQLADSRTAEAEA